METIVTDDFLGNLAQITQSLQSMNTNTPTGESRIDLTGIDEIETNIPQEKFTVPIVGFGSEDKPLKDKPSEEKLPEEKLPEDPLTDEEEEKEKESKDVHKKFKDDVKELSRIEELINEYNELLKKLRKKKTELRKKTIKHMVKHEIDTLNMKENEKINLVKVNRKVNPTTKARLPDKLKDYFIKEENMSEEDAAKKSEKIFKWLHDTAEKTVNHSLRRYKPRKKRNTK